MRLRLVRIKRDINSKKLTYDEAREKLISIINLKYGAYTNQNISELLSDAILNNGLKSFEEKIADFKSYDLRDYTLLHHAAHYGCVKAMAELVKLGININTMDSRYATPLHDAARLGKVESIVELLRLGADTEATGILGSTALYNAATNGKVESIVELIKFGANIDTKDIAGKTALDGSKYFRHTDVQKVLMYVQLVDSIYVNKSSVLSAAVDKQKEHISKIITALIEASDYMKESLSKRIANKLWNTSSGNVKEIQQEIVDKINNINKNIALIKDTDDIDLSFLKDSFVHSEKNPNGFVHDNGIMTLSTLTLLSLARSNQMEEVLKLNASDITERVLHLSKISGISKLLSLSTDIIAKLEAAAGDDQSQTVTKLEESNNSSHYTSSNIESNEELKGSNLAGSSADNVD